jgi:hypothetical protein
MRYSKNSLRSVASQTFTLMEVVLAIAIFAMGISVMLDRRNQSVEDSHYAKQLLEVQTIIDDIFADYRLHPFEEEPRELLRDYSPFEVDVQVSKESINIIPEDWRLDESYEDDVNKKKKRIILRISVTVDFTGLDESLTHKVQASTLIRLIELDDDPANAGSASNNSSASKSP